MKKFSSKTAVVISALMMSEYINAEDTLASAFSSGTVNGNIRAYYNTRSYDTREDESGFALGGALRAETGMVGVAKIGVGYYTAHDMSLNPDTPAEINGRLGDELEVLAEAYISLTLTDTKVTVGRQKINTPFANPSDAFIVPMTFSGYALENTSLSNVKFNFAYLNEFKNRNSNQFTDVGAWSTNRYGVDVTNTSGTLALGATYKASNLNIQGWYYEFSDLFNLMYTQVNYNISTDAKLKPFVGFQYGMQADVGDKLLGSVDSSVLGIKAGFDIAKAKITLAYNSVPEEDGSYKNGAFLAPFNFSTSPLFTNNMLQTVENNDAGDGIKLTFNYTFADNMPFKISYATFDFENIADRDAVDLDLTYKFAGNLRGFSIRGRIEIVSSDTDTVEQINNRLQLQYVY